MAVSLSEADCHPPQAAAPDMILPLSCLILPTCNGWLALAEVATRHPAVGRREGSKKARP